LGTHSLDEELELSVLVRFLDLQSAVCVEVVGPVFGQLLLWQVVGVSKFGECFQPDLATVYDRMGAGCLL
jgi:hypothetical protein